MDFHPAIWNVIHDGIIVAVRGAVPGTVQLDVSIDYLRKRFHDTGKTIQVNLTNCTRFAYRDFNESGFTTDFSAIAAFNPIVLSGELRGELCVIDCAGGILEVKAAGGSLALDSGRVISLQELIGVAEAYWAKFGRVG